MTEHAPTRRPTDPRAVAIAGLSTLAWYAVPDVVRPRWARALAKAAVATTGAALTVAVTTEGREAREGVQQLRDAIRSTTDRAAEAADDGDRSTPVTGRGDHRADRPVSGTTVEDAVREDNTYVPDRGIGPVPVPLGLLAGAAFGGVALGTTLAVAGEKWAYRRGERLRARGVRLPHTRVGLVLGGLAVALAALEPLLWNAEDRTRP